VTGSERRATCKYAKAMGGANVGCTWLAQNRQERVPIWMDSGQMEDFYVQAFDCERCKAWDRGE